jgi:hypothetical protein
METKVLRLYSPIADLGHGGPERCHETAEARELYGKQDLTVLKDLQHLTLEYLYDDLSGWMSQLLQILKRSPGLQTLSLGLATETIVRVGDEEQGHLYFDFFGRLCEGYAEAGGSPLPLRTLRCGTALYPMDSGSLTKLTDLAYLEEIYIENQGIYDDKDYIALYEDGSGGSGIVFDAFGPQNCPNLSRFSAAQYKRDIHDYLCTIPEPFARRLAVSFETQDEEYEMEKLIREDPDYPSLPLQLRMMDLELDRLQWLNNDEDTIPADQVFEDLITNNAEALEGLTVHLRENKGADGGFDDLDILGNALGRLPNLTQLALDVDRKPRQWGGVTQDMMLRAAERLAAVAAPRLRYINVRHRSWKILRGSEGSWRLEKMDRREKQDVELLCHSIFCGG